MSQESEYAETVVDAYEDDILVRPLLSVELRLGAPALAVSAAVDPESHGKLLVDLSGSFGPHIQIETVLAVGSLVAIAPFGSIASGIVHGLI